ncbi:uncharacterized protein LOC125227034 [Leguminivora glycinivorella]|uniref:uncharacterized protein LOC125227034 n=1 Tax=Leguminivora glycinivorella TaxID=1035111 RepID=UPI0020108419|nr:uncharacterized protein LOC125227034 [Leguminivora glycinivorella]
MANIHAGVVSRSGLTADDLYTPTCARTCTVERPTQYWEASPSRSRKFFLFEATSPVQRQGEVTKKKKKSKRQRIAERLAREQQPANTPNPAPGEGASASQKPAPKPGPNQQGPSGRHPPKGKGPSQPPKAGTSTSTPAGPATGKNKKKPGKHSRAAAKRARDESFSPQGDPKKQRLVNPNQPGVSYAQAAASDLTIVVTDAKSGRITADQSNAILRAFHKAIVEDAKINTDEGAAPSFKGKPAYAEGQLRVFARDEYSAAWAQRNIKSLTLPNLTLTAVRQSELARRVRCGLLIPNIDNSSWENVQEAAIGLKYQNGWAKVTSWSIIEILRQDQGWFVAFTIPEELVPAFMERGRALSCGMGTIYLKFRGPGGKYVDQPPAPQGTTLGTASVVVPDQQAMGTTPVQFASASGEKDAPPSTSKLTTTELSEDELLGIGEGPAEAPPEGEDLTAWIETGLADMLKEGGEMQDEAPTTVNMDTD